MSQYVIAQITNFERGFFKYHDLQKSREWDESVPEFRTFAELAVGIMGVGNIGFGSKEGSWAEFGAFVFKTIVL